MFPPVDPTRCRFLSNAAGGTVLALAAIPPTPTSAAPAGLPDPVFSLIEAHRRARAAYLVALAEQNRLDEIGDRTADWVAAKQCDADIAALENLVETVSTTFAGLVAWASYLDEMACGGDTWVFEEGGTTLIATLVEALGNLAVAS